MVGDSQRVFGTYEMIYYSLSNRSEINLEKIMKEIHKLLTSQKSLTNKVLVIKIENITLENNDIIPKIEYKNI